MPSRPAKSRPSPAAPLFIALGVHVGLAAILAVVPVYRARTAHPSPTVRVQFGGLVDAGGEPTAGGSGDVREPSTSFAPAPLPAAVTTPAFPVPPAPRIVVGVFEPLPRTTVAHLNIELGTITAPTGTGDRDAGRGSGTGADAAAGVAGGAGRGAGGRGELPAGRRIPKPRYPVLARQRGWEGTTVLVIEIRPSGRVGHVEVRQSSGHRLLDEACVDTLRRWAFDPIPTARRVEIPVSFRLTEG